MISDFQIFDFSDFRILKIFDFEICWKKVQKWLTIFFKKKVFGIVGKIDQNFVFRFFQVVKDLRCGFELLTPNNYMFG